MATDDLGSFLTNMSESPTIEDLILLVGTLTAFLAFILWCCFPLQKDSKQQFSNCRASQHVHHQATYSNPKHYSIKNDSYYYT